jgi:hypothetical protein
MEEVTRPVNTSAAKSAERTQTVPGKGDRDGNGNNTGIMDSDFIPLDELVYAPLHALAESNLQLRSHVIDCIKQMGTTQQNGQEEIIHLNNMNIAYDQIRQDSDDSYSVENLQLQVPMLSIVPISNLNVERATVDFSSEIRVTSEQNGKYKINGRICSPEQRDSNYLPRVSYSMKVKSTPATEGILRLTDLLNTNHIAKQLDSTPVTVDGNLGTDDQKQTWQQLAELRAKVKKLRALYQKVEDSLTEQERLYEISNDANAADTVEVDREYYLKTESDIANSIIRYEDQIMKLQISEENDIIRTQEKDREV